MASLGEAFVEVIADTSPFGDSLSDGIGDALAGVQGEVADAFAGVGGVAEDAFSEVTDAAASAGSAVGEGMETGAAEAQEALDSIDGEGMVSRIQDNMGKVSLAFAGIGAASEGFARKQNETNRVLGRVGIASGLAGDELDELISSMVDNTFAATDAAAGMERLIRSGIDTKEEFEKILPAMDTFSDATGIDMVGSIDIFDKMLSALGIPLEEAEDHLDTLAFVATQTTVDLNQLGALMRREAGTLRDYGMDTEDVAAAMAALEAEGIRGPRAVMAFQNALKEGEGDMAAFEEALGISSEALETQRQRLAEAEGLTEAYADSNNELRTPMEKLQVTMGNVAFRFRGLSGVAGAAAAPIAAMGPVMMSVNATSQVLGKALPALGKALGGVGKAFMVLGKAILANPIFLIAAVIIGLGLLFWRFRDDIVEAIQAAWDFVKDATTAVFDWLRDAFTKVLNWIRTNWEKLRELIAAPIRAAADFVRQTWDRIRTSIQSAIDRVVNFVRTAFDNLRRIVTTAVDNVRNGVVDRFNSVVSFVADIPARILRGLGNLASLLLGAGRSVIQGLWDGMRAVWDRVTGWIGGIGDTIRNLKGPLSYDRVMLTDIGEAIIGGLGKGMEDEWDNVSRMLSGMTAEIPLAVRSDSMDAISGGMDVARPGSRRGGGGTVIEFTVNNPSPEPASVSASREMRKLAALGVFE